MFCFVFFNSAAHPRELQLLVHLRLLALLPIFKSLGYKHRIFQKKQWSKQTEGGGESEGGK